MKKIVILIFPVLFTFSCERILFEDKIESESPSDNFEYLWRECDEKYSFFEVKNINWDSIYTIYSEKINEGLSDDELFSILADMLNELKDGHVNLISYFNISHYNIEQLGPDNFEYRIIKENYMSEDYYVSGPFRHDFIANGHIGYVRFSEFSGMVDSKNLDFILERYEETEGLILDLRENGGGTPLDIYEILGRFVQEETYLFDSRIKTGPGHNEFSELQPAEVSPSGRVRYESTVAVLTDRGSYSASSFFALACKSIPNITLIGDTTGGGLGLPNGGQLPNGWQYRFSITQTLDTLGNNFEPGVPPDITVIMTDQDRINGVDPVIDRAIDELIAISSQE